MSGRIAYVCSGYPALREAFIVREVLALERAGLDVRVYSLKRPDERFTSRELAATSARPHWSPHVLSWELVRDNVATFLRAPLRYVGWPIATAWRLRRHPLQALKSAGLFPKLVHYGCHMRRHGVTGVNACWASLPATAAVVAREFFGIPFCMTCRAWDIYVPVNQVELTDKISAATAVRANNDAGAAFVRRFCAGPEDEAKVRRVYNPFDVDAVTPRDRVPPGPFTVVSGGSLIEKKGLDVLIEAVALLGRDGVTCRARVIGEGPLRRSLESRAAELRVADLVEFLGPMSNDRVLREMREAHAFALPSVPAASGSMDGIPNVLIESMALGVPTVSTRISGIPELIEDGTSGLLVAPRDAAGLAAALRRLAESPELQRRLGLGGRARVESMFDMNRNARALVDLYTAAGLLR